VTTKRRFQQINSVHSLLDQTIHYYTYHRGLSQILHGDLHCSMWQIGSSTSLVLQSTDVSTTKRRSIW